MPFTLINPDSVHAPTGYSHAAIVTGRLLIVAGQIALGENGDIVGRGDFDAQAVQVFKNLRKVLAAAGTSEGDVVRLGIYLSDRKYLPQYRAVRSGYFSEPYPVSNLFIAGLVLPELMIEVEAMAVLPD